MEFRTTKDICATIRESLKKEIPQCKFSVIGDNYSMGRSINVALMEGPFDVFNPTYTPNQNWDGKLYAQVNHYQLRDEWKDNSNGQNNGAYLTKECWEVMKKATEITSREHWDKSDIQSDYFNCNFYIHMAIGKWNKPYIKKGV